MNKALLLFAVFCIAVAGVGCSAGSQQLDEDYLANAEQIGKARKALFDKAGGDWNALTPDEKQEFQKGLPDEAAAMKTWEVMKGGPPRSLGAPGVGGTTTGTNVNQGR